MAYLLLLAVLLSFLATDIHFNGFKLDLSTRKHQKISKDKTKTKCF